MKRISKCITGLISVFSTLVLMVGFVQAGNLEPSGPPGPTTQIPPAWSQIIPGADRFELVMGGAAVLDKETGLVWDQSPDITTRSWNDALGHCFQRQVGGRKGWRLPTIAELASLVDTSVSAPTKLPVDSPFSSVSVHPVFYWSSSTRAGDTTRAWLVFFANGVVDTNFKTNVRFVWCVRGGQGHDAR